MNSLSPKEAASLLRQKDNILILTHRRPDGDTTGCAAGLCLALRQLGKTAWLLDNPDMTEINGTYTAGLWAPADFAPEFVVSVDIAARSLFFPAAEAYFDRLGLAVDHHPSFEGFGAAQCVDASRAACGEIVYDICRSWGRSPGRLPCLYMLLWRRIPAALSMPTQPPTPTGLRRPFWRRASTTLRSTSAISAPRAAGVLPLRRS